MSNLEPILPDPQPSKTPDGSSSSSNAAPLSGLSSMSLKLPKVKEPTPSFPVSHTIPSSHDPHNLAMMTLSLPASNFVMSGSPLLFEPSTASIVLIHDKPSGRYFLPRGRKDRNESLADCAIREGYEESGFRGQLIDWGSRGTYQPKQPAAPGVDVNANKEAFWIQAQPAFHNSRGLLVIYFTYYFIGMVSPDAVSDPDKSRLVGLHEQGYEGVLVPVADAIRLLCKQKTPGNHDSMVFVPYNNSKECNPKEWQDLDSTKALKKDGKLWAEQATQGEWEDMGEEEWKKDKKVESKLSPAKGQREGETETLRIEQETAGRLVDKICGELVPTPWSGADDSILQARIIWEAWDRLVKVYDVKEQESSQGQGAPGSESASGWSFSKA